MIAIIDYGVGNLFSLRSSLTHLGLEAVVTADAQTIRKADRLILPGVGAFGDAMDKLSATGLVPVIREQAAQKPLLGICLGCQILLEHSEENDVRTLGIVPGRCVRFPDHMKEEDGSPAPVPHMGWNSLDVVRPGRLLHGIEPGAEFYFVHSYYVEPAPELVMATTVYGKEFCSVYGRDGLWAVQCHLEKSGRPGLTVLRNFYDYCDEVRHA